MRRVSRNITSNNINNQIPAPPTISAADELLKWKHLLDDGIITQDEFNEKKKQLLK